jgi:flagellar protein FliO/FliZ
LRIPPFIYGAASAALSMVLLAPAVALGATGTGENTPLSLPADSGVGGGSNHTTASGSGSLVRTFVGLAIVLAVIYGIAWVLKQVKRSKEERGQGTSLETTAVVALGPNRSLHLVRAGRELVLVGVAEHGVTPIRTYTEDEAIDLGLISEDDAELDGTPPTTTSRAGAVRWLDRLKDRTVRR